MAKDPDDRLYSPSELVQAAAEALGLSVPDPIGPSSRGLGQVPAESRVGERDAGNRRHPQAAAAVRFPALREKLLALVTTIVVMASGAAGFVVSRSGGQDGEVAVLRSPRPQAQRAHREYLRAVNAQVERLNRRRVTGRRRMAAAGRSSVQAAEALRLAAAYRSSARSISAFPASDRRTPSLALLLVQTEGAYRRMAAALRRRDRRKYASAVRTARQREAELERELLRLGSRFR